MKKRLFALVLTLALCLSISAPAFATETINVGNLSTEEQIELEISEREEEVYRALYSQLAAQDALGLYEKFQAVLHDEIVAEVQMKYSDEVSEIAATTASRTFTYGGSITYHNPGLYADYSATYLDYDNSYYWVLNRNRFTCSDIIETILGYIPVVGSVFSGIFTILSIRDSQASAAITAADGYARILNLYDCASGEEASFIYGWTTYPTASVSNSMEDIRYTSFPQHDPWED